MNYSAPNSLHNRELDINECYTHEFDAIMHRLQLENAPAGGAFLVYKDGHCVVSSCIGKARLDQPDSDGLSDEQSNQWTTHTLSLNFSTGKGVLATLIHVLVTQGLLDYDTPIAAYWQEFACNGKESVTLRSVMSHQTALFTVDSIIERIDEMQDWQRMLSLVASMTFNNKKLPPDNYSSTYNALVYGWILGGLIERVTKLSLQQALDKYLAEPLGISGEVYFKLPADKLKHLALPARCFAKAEILEQADASMQQGKSKRRRAKPVLRADGKETLETYRQLIPFKLWQQSYISKTDNLAASNSIEKFDYLNTGQINSLYLNPQLLHLPSYKSSLMPDSKKDTDYYDEGYLLACIPALTCIASANALAKIYAMLANKGSFNGQSVIDAEVFAQLSKVQTHAMDTVMPASIYGAKNADSMLWRLGYHRVFSLQHALDHPNAQDSSKSEENNYPNAFGHFGYNGSMAWCDVEQNLAVVYIHNYESTLLTDIRQFALTESLYTLIKGQ